ncbi:MAG: DUF5684 domain-containing protein [Bacteroidia bacterium]
MENDVAFGIIGLVSVGFILVIIGLIFYSWWVIFEKAGEEGWKAIIPFYNYWTLFEISGKPGWWSLAFLGMIIPIVNFFVSFGLYILYILAMVDLAKKFKTGDGFVVGLILLPIVFFPILAFGDYQYHGDFEETLDDKIDNIGNEESSGGDGVEEINVKDW